MPENREREMEAYLRRMAEERASYREAMQEREQWRTSYQGHQWVPVNPISVSATELNTEFNNIINAQPVSSQELGRGVEFYSTDESGTITAEQMRALSEQVTRIGQAQTLRPAFSATISANPLSWGGALGHSPIVETIVEVSFDDMFLKFKDMIRLLGFSGTHDMSDLTWGKFVEMKKNEQLKYMYKLLQCQPCRDKYQKLLEREPYDGTVYL